MTTTEPTASVEIRLDDGRRVHGFVDEGFGGVLDSFVANFEHRQDVGAACAAYLGNRLVVDLWGGIADRPSGRPWTHHSAAVIFSCSKGIIAICIYLLVQEGRIDLDAPISGYWPEFAANGKAAITLRDALSHRSGLPAPEVDLTLNEVLAWDPVIHALEAQRPLFRPEEGYFYHAMTYGWIVGEVIRRVTGQTPGRFFRERIGDRLGLRTWIGLPPEARESVARMEPPLPDEDSEAAREAARRADANPLIVRSVTMGGAYAFPAAEGFVTFNAPAIQAAEVPGANGISTAPSLARLYAACLAGIDGDPLLSPSSIADALVVRSAGQSLSGSLDDGVRWGTGFQLSSPPTQPMLGESSFGHAGAGGQLAFADAEHGTAFAYLGNQMGGYGDARARELTAALSAAVGA